MPQLCFSLLRALGRLGASLSVQPPAGLLQKALAGFCRLRLTVVDELDGSELVILLSQAHADEEGPVVRAGRHTDISSALL